MTETPKDQVEDPETSSTSDILLQPPLGSWPSRRVNHYMVLWAWASTDLKVSGPPKYTELAIIYTSGGVDGAKRKAANPKEHPEVAAFIINAASQGVGILLRAVPLTSWPETVAPTRLEVPPPKLEIG